MDRTKGGEVGTLESHVLHQPVCGCQELQITFIRTARNKLSDRRRPATIPALIGGLGSTDLLHPLQWPEQFFDKGFIGGKLCEPLCVGSFQINGHAVCKLHDTLDLRLLCTGHDLEVHVPTEAKSIAQDVGSIQYSVLCVRAACSNP